MKRKMLMIFILFLSFFLVSCSKGISIGDVFAAGGREFPGYIQMQLDEDEYDLKETILLQVSYGHDYIENFNENNHVLAHRISVYTIDGSYSGNFDNPSEFIQFYEVSYEGDDLGSDVYRCYPGKTIFSKVEYNMTIDLNLDIRDIGYDYGLLVMKFEEDFVNQDNIDGEIIETQVVHYFYTFIYFLKDDTTIQFSKKSFA